MSADADRWWRNRRQASANPGDAWSGGGRSYRGWMGAEPERDAPAPIRSGWTAVPDVAQRKTPSEPASARPEQTAAAGVCKRGGRSVPRASRVMRARRLQNAARPFRPVADALLFVLTGLPLARFRSRKRLRVLLGVGAAGLAAVVFLAPLAWAGRLDPCAAAEVALVDEAVGRGSRFEGGKRRVANWTGPDGKLFSHGRVGRQIAAEEHGGWPPPLGCTALFWRVRSEDAALGGVSLLRFAPAVARR